MIPLTRLNTKSLIVNSDLIEFIENAPDTVITFVTGEKIVVRETADEIIDLILRFRRRLLPTTLAVLPPILDSTRSGGENSEDVKDSSGG
jgi:flagellar protein FlbD